MNFFATFKPTSRQKIACFLVFVFYEEQPFLRGNQYQITQNCYYAVAKNSAWANKLVSEL